MTSIIAITGILAAILALGELPTMRRYSSPCSLAVWMAADLWAWSAGAWMGGGGSSQSGLGRCDIYATEPRYIRSIFWFWTNLYYDSDRHSSLYDYGSSWRNRRFICISEVVHFHQLWCHVVLFGRVLLSHLLLPVVWLPDQAECCATVFANLITTVLVLAGAMVLYESLMLVLTLSLALCAERNVVIILTEGTPGRPDVSEMIQSDTAYNVRTLEPYREPEIT